jgi:hypothetical protein
LNGKKTVGRLKLRKGFTHSHHASGLKRVTVERCHFFPAEKLDDKEKNKTLQIERNLPVQCFSVVAVC